MDWRHRASCRDEDGELFFATGNSGPALLQIAEAKTVCRRCPVSAQCLNFALTMGLDDGVFGGLSEDERRALKRRNTRTRAKAAAVEQEPVERPTPVRVDGRLMAAPPTLLDRQYQDRAPAERREHALMSNGKSACGGIRLDMERRRPVSELGASKRCRTIACRKLFAAADREQEPAPVDVDAQPVVHVEPAEVAPVFATAGDDTGRWHALDEHGIPSCGEPTEIVVRKLARHVGSDRRCRRPRCASSWARLDMDMAVSHG